MKFYFRDITLATSTANFSPPSPISRTIDPSRARAGKESMGINRIDGERPDRWHSPIGPIGPIGGDALPPRPAIVAHE